MHRSLIKFFVCSILFFAGCGGLLKTPHANIDPGLLQTKNQIDAFVQQIEKKHSIRIYYDKSPWLSRLFFNYQFAADNDLPGLLKYMQVFQKELDKYPENFLFEAKIKSIIICKDISFLGHSAQGFCDPGSNTIYLEYFDHPDSKVVIHHEIYHMIEARYYGNSCYKDTAWAKLNIKDFHYGSGGRFFQRQFEDWDKPFYHPCPGFITTYAKSALEEDKADVYAVLCIEELRTCLDQWIKDDAVLRNKVNYMKAFLLQYWEKMNDQSLAEL